MLQDSLLCESLRDWQRHLVSGVDLVSGVRRGLRGETIEGTWKHPTLDITRAFAACFFLFEAKVIVWMRLQ